MSQESLIVPDDFTTPVGSPYALSGVQLKMNLIHGADGRFYASGTDPVIRLQRYRECLEEIEWSVELLQGKLLKPKYQALPLEVILKSLGMHLVRDRGLSPPEAVWALQKIASRLQGHR